MLPCHHGDPPRAVADTVSCCDGPAGGQQSRTAEGVTGQEAAAPQQSQHPGELQEGAGFTSRYPSTRCLATTTV